MISIADGLCMYGEKAGIKKGIENGIDREIEIRNKEFAKVLLEKNMPLN